MTDLPKVETVARATWRVAYTGIIPDEVQRRLLDGWYSAESLRRALAAPQSSFFVAESNGAVIGFAQFVRRSAESAELARNLRVARQAAERRRDAVARRRAGGIRGEGLKTPDRPSRARQPPWPSFLRAGRLCRAARAHARAAEIRARVGRIPAPDPREYAAHSRRAARRPWVAKRLKVGCHARRGRNNSIVQQDLRPSRASQDLVAEMHTRAHARCEVAPPRPRGHRR